MKYKYHYAEYMYILEVFMFVDRDCKRFTVKKGIIALLICAQTLNFVAYTYRTSKNYRKSDEKYVKSLNFSVKIQALHFPGWKIYCGSSIFRFNYAIF